MLPFFHGLVSKNGDPIKLSPGVRFVASSTKVQLGALFLNCKEGIIFCLTIEE